MTKSFMFPKLTLVQRFYSVRVGCTPNSCLLAGQNHLLSKVIRNYISIVPAPACLLYVVCVSSKNVVICWSPSNVAAFICFVSSICSTAVPDKKFKKTKKVPVLHYTLGKSKGRCLLVKLISDLRSLSSFFLPSLIQC